MVYPCSYYVSSSTSRTIFVNAWRMFNFEMWLWYLDDLRANLIGLERNIRIYQVKRKDSFFIFLGQFQFNFSIKKDYLSLNGKAFGPYFLKIDIFRRFCGHSTMGISASEKRINKGGWKSKNRQNQRKTDKYCSIFAEEITKQLKKW